MADRESESLPITLEIAKDIDQGNGESQALDEEKGGDHVRTSEGPVEGHELSKNQQKKLKRRQQWEDERPARKAARKQKHKAAKERRREKIRSGELTAKPAKQPHINSTQVPVTFVIDCQFESLMTPEELVSMAGQITRCYSDHKKAKYRPHLAVSSFDGFLKERFEGLLKSQHKAWGVEFRQSHFAKVAEEATVWMEGVKGGQLDGALLNPEKEMETSVTPAAEPPLAQGEVVYLTSDSPDSLRQLKPYSTYIIGGLVDKNRHKGICYQRACDHNIRTAKLPIGDYIKMSSRQVLTTNHVHEIMLKWLEKGDWKDAFMSVIPPRKGGELLTTGQSEPDHGEHEERE